VDHGCAESIRATGVDRHGFDHVIRFQGVERYLAYSHGEKDCVALGCGSINLYLHRLDSGEQVGVLHVDEEVKMVYCMAVSNWVSLTILE
jgi:hypothetical protein